MLVHLAYFDIILAYQGGFALLGITKKVNYYVIHSRNGSKNQSSSSDQP